MGRGDGEKEAKRQRGRSSKRSRNASPSPSSDSDSSSSSSPSSDSSPSRSPEPRSRSSKHKKSASSSSRRHRHHHKSSGRSRSSRDDDRRRHRRRRHLSRSDSDDSDRLEEAQEIVRDILTEFPAVATELRQLLQMVDSGEGIDISEISDKPLVKRLKKLFRSLKLKESANGAYLLPPKSVPTLDVVGPALVGNAKLGDDQNENVASRERQVPPPNFDVQNRDATSPEDGGQVRVEDAPVKRVIDPAMPSRELLAAAAEMTEALRCRDAELEADDGFLIGPPPPAMVAEAASANEAERFEEVTRILGADADALYDVLGINWKMPSDNIKKRNPLRIVCLPLPGLPCFFPKSTGLEGDWEASAMDSDGGGSGGDGGGSVGDGGGSGGYGGLPRFFPKSTGLEGDWEASRLDPDGGGSGGDGDDGNVGHRAAGCSRRMAPVRRRPGDPPPQYGPSEEVFSVEINHGGLFCGTGKNKTYVDCRTDYFDDCEVETWSPLWIQDFVQQLGLDPNKMQFNWLLPGMGFSDGLRIIDSDADTLMMTAVVPKFQYFKLYVTEKDIFAGLELDDICIVGSPELPPVMSPQRNDSDDDSDSNFGDDLVDSDNEFDKGDDDLFNEWVDHDVRDKKKVKEWIDDDYDSDDLVLPESDSEYEQDSVEEETENKDGEGSNAKKKKKKKKVKLRSFRPEDMQAPSFKIGMIFPSVVELRKAIQEYIIQNRVPIKYKKNDLKRVRAHCVEDCPWFLFAAPYNNTKSFVVKTYVGTHNCSGEWEINPFTAKYLAVKYIEDFRANDKMTLRNFARLVQTDFNMTPSRSKLSRARRLAMQEIHGDEIMQYEQLWDYAGEVRSRNTNTLFCCRHNLLRCRRWRFLAQFQSRCSLLGAGML